MKAAEGLSEIDCRRARVPGERRAGRLGVARRARVAGEELEQRGELLAAADRGEDERRRRRPWNDEGRRAQDPIEPRLGAANVADVVEREFVRVIALEAHEPEVGEEIPFARTPPCGPPRAGRSTAAVPTGSCTGSTELSAFGCQLSAMLQSVY